MALEPIYNTELSPILKPTSAKSFDSYRYSQVFTGSSLEVDIFGGPLFSLLHHAVRSMWGNTTLTLEM